MADPTFDPSKPFDVQEAPAAAPAAPVAAPAPDEFKAGSNPFRDEDFPTYSQMVMDRKTTPAQLTEWMEQRGYGRSTNAAEVLTFHRRNPRIRPTNTFTLNPAEEAPAPDGMPQPGTSTDWIPDFLQDDVERIGLSLGIIDPKTYYGLGNYGPNARKPNRPTTISNPALPSWGERFARSVGETFSDEGGGVNAYILRANDDIRADESIRRYGSEHNWTGEQIDAAIKREKEDRGRAIEEVRAQRAIRDNDEVRRAEGLGVDENGKARSSWSGWAGRGSADLAGAVVGDANPTYFVAPAVRGVAPLVERAAPVIGRLLPKAAAPIAERAVVAAAPTAARAVGQGGVQAGINTGTQADEVERGLRENIDPVEVGIHGLLGAGFQGGAEGLGKLAPQVARWVTGRGGKVEGTVPNAEGLGSLESDLALLADRGIAPDTIGSVDDIRVAAARIRNPEQPVPEPEGGAIAPEQRAPVAPDAVDPVAPAAEPAAASPDGAPEVDVVTRLTDVLKGASKQSKANAASLAEFRSQQARALAEIRNRTDLSGEQKLNAELAALKGSAEKEGLDIKAQFSEKDIGELFNRIDTSPAFQQSVFGSLNAKVGLRKILEGEVPTPSEMNRLAQVFPPDFIKSALRMRGNKKLLNNISNAMNLPRAMMATADLSAPLRQGIVFTGRKEFYTALPTMLREFREGFLKNDKVPTAERGQNWQSSGSTVLDEIKSRPTYDSMEESGLAITNPYDNQMANREEDFMSNLAEKIPGFGRLAKGSNAAYAGFLNKLRADVFDSLSKGQNLSKEELAGISRFINSATGRGDLGSLNKAAPVLNAAFFSPRLVKARVDMLNPVFYARLPPAARKAAIADMLKFGGLATTVLTLAHLGGADVETDPRSSDFAKIKTGNTRLDVLGGFPQYVTLAARLATGETKTLKGNVKELDGKPFSGTRLEVLGRFARNKLAPVPAYAATALQGTNPIGEPYDPVDTTARMFIPLYVQGLEDVMKDETTSTKTKAAVAIASLFGVGSQSFDANAPKVDPKEPMIEEDLPADAEVVEPVAQAEGEFDPSQPFDTTTSANLGAVDIVSNMGLTPTDEGVRSEADQARYYNTTNGAAKPGTSPHELGNAVDVRVPSGVKPSEIVAQFKARGYKGVTIITKRHGTGPHWHIQWDSAPE
jgi:hypothetical protein